MICMKLWHYLGVGARAGNPCFSADKWTEVCWELVGKGVLITQILKEQWIPRGSFPSLFLVSQKRCPSVYKTSVLSRKVSAFEYSQTTGRCANRTGEGISRMSVSWFRACETLQFDLSKKMRKCYRGMQRVIPFSELFLAVSFHEYKDAHGLKFQSEIDSLT